MVYRINILSIIFFLFLFSQCGNKQNEIYINGTGNDGNSGTIENPIQSLEKAIDLASHMRQKNDKHISIFLSAGDYYLSAPILINSELNNLSINGDGVDKVSIKGSAKLQGNWSKYKENIWQMKLSENLDFDQLFIDGTKQILARYPNFNEEGGFWQGNAADAFSAQRISSWENPKGAFFHVMHSGKWGDFHYEVTGIDSLGNAMLIGGHQNNRPSAMHPSLRMVENVFEELDSQGEWYLDKEKSILYLWPNNEVDLKTASVEVSTLNALIKIKGSIENPVKNVTVQGVKFEQCNRTFMEEYHPLLRSDWTIYRGGAILLEGTENCRITNCEFTNLGGNVIFANNYNREIKIEGNHIHHCGASAISFVGDTSAVRSPSYQYYQFVSLQNMDTIPGPANDNYSANCLVENNLIYKIGRVEKQVAGVQISMAMDIHVKNNTIYDVPRAGINVSEGSWGGHIIEYNDVFNTVLESSDHGSFNSWGRDRFWHPNRRILDSITKANPEMPYLDAIHTTIIRNNRFSCHHGWDIDLDDGSSNYKIYNNLCLNGGIKLREGFYRTVENNIMINNGFHPHVWFLNSGDVFRENILMLSHSDIALQAWGKEVDYNLFPDSISLMKAQKNGTDKHSIYGYPGFKDPKHGDFSISDEQIKKAIGFINFPMDSFGVLLPHLKAKSKQVAIPELNLSSYQQNKVQEAKWLKASIKNITSLEEKSAYGLHDIKGVIMLEIPSNSILKDSDLKVGDIILKMDHTEINNIADLLNLHQKNLWKEDVKLSIYRHQKNKEINIKLK